VAAQGVGICAMFGGARFRPLATVCISRLCSVIIDERFSTRTRLYDTTVAALGKICEFQREYIRGPK
ncbi:Armadillo-like helical, partial [Sesbania bispinosa]